MDAQTRLEIQNLTEQQQQYVIQTLPAKEKSLSSAYIFWVLFGAHYFYLHKPFKNIFLWLLCCIYIGVIWWVFDLFHPRCDTAVPETPESTRRNHRRGI